MAEIDFMSSLHNLTKRDYLGRVNDKTFPKHVSAELAKNTLMIIGMVIEEFVMVAIST